jgi:(2Fe-2S) ferredoxin
METWRRPLPSDVTPKVRSRDDGGGVAPSTIADARARRLGCKRCIGARVVARLLRCHALPCRDVSSRVAAMSPRAGLRFERHVFVCVHARPAGGKPSCGARDAATLHAAFLDAVAADPALCGRVAVTETGCLGPCFEGPNVVVYPEGVWYAGVAARDVALIATQHLRDGRQVEHLVRNEVDDGDQDDDGDSDSGA